MDAVGREQYIKGVEAQLEQIRECLAPLESGHVRMQSRHGDEPWRDTTDDVIATHKRNIATYQSILTALRKGEIP